jgi:hypothetical protein
VAVLPIISMGSLILSVSDILERGLRCAKVDPSNLSRNGKEFKFHKFYGSNALSLADAWYDLIVTDLLPAHLKISAVDKRRGLKMFFAAHFYLWNKPKNAVVFGSTFELCEKYSRGSHLWVWIKRIGAMKVMKIVWKRGLDDPRTEIYAVSADATDCRDKERKHPTLARDTGTCSKKFKHAALKYEIGLSVKTGDCVWINGPYRGGLHDQTVMREGGLLNKLKPGKLCIVDRGYINFKHRDKLSWPNPYDSKQVNNFKSRARLRHETFNGRIKFFNILKETFEHAQDLHKCVFEAVCVIVQYQMENGSPLFSV